MNFERNRKKYRYHVHFAHAATPQRSNRVPDRKKQRLNYLLKKGTAQARLVTVTLIACFIIVTLVAGCVLADALMQHLYDEWRRPALTVCCGLFFVAFFFLMRDGDRVLSNLKQDADSIPYVPPVTLDTLPAEEVLVRGAEPPAVTSDTLLRAAQTGVAEAKPEELLRSSLP